MSQLIVPFSRKQLKLLTWWLPNSPVAGNFGIIADGAIRAGKTFPMSLSFVEWAFANFDGQNFLLCGKTVGSLRRNVTAWLVKTLRQNGYQIEERRTENQLIVTGFGRTNTFHLFGGRDESSQDLVQGITAAGALFDEVALMPESFVNQTTGRCSVEGAKLWFNCNPDSPSHWFKLNWLDKTAEKRLVHLHFTMEDNPSLSEGTRERYRGLYAGVFFKRFILGLWVMAEGAIYDMLDDANFYDELPLREHLWENGFHFTATDYGTQNATVFLHFIDDGTRLWIDDEYYHSGRSTGVQKTDSQYADDYERFCEGKPVTLNVLDPSAASFKAELRNRSIRIKDADNEVLDGIRLVSTVMARRILMINRRRCKNTIRELQSYVWDPKPTEKGKEQPMKKDDHGPDAVRYGVKTMFNTN